ncbi:hypothetical protein VCHC17A1_3982A, partial [Vibrio cholerae HC-17A1]
MPTVICFPAND